ncbi:hypothetical protein E7811_02505 [Aliigemmobacter aestuarii]|uniref:DUF4064 domain-containing protein n=1 Tax=Aliigemmobacter aestuarii TaxID=1445661 RepID=A0A4S3MQA6_9RHOB|nr:hypothetical protein [Gemmobacter aestuarii]THD84628.1 hypothetical protein E7811_02505 [Gemmobacter aestuarii]
MRNAALVLGIIGGLWAMVIGFFGYGYTVFIDTYGEVPDLATQVQNPALIKAAGFLAPILAIAGGAMARSANMVAAALLAVAGVLVWYAFGFGVFTMFPIGMCMLGAILALAARQPDPH